MKKFRRRPYFLRRLLNSAAIYWPFPKKLPIEYAALLVARRYFDTEMAEMAEMLFQIHGKESLRYYVHSLAGFHKSPPDRFSVVAMPGFNTSSEDGMPFVIPRKILLNYIAYFDGRFSYRSLNARLNGKKKYKWPQPSAPKITSVAIADLYNQQSEDLGYHSEPESIPARTPPVPLDLDAILAPNGNVDTEEPRQQSSEPCQQSSDDPFELPRDIVPKGKSYEWKRVTILGEIDRPYIRKLMKDGKWRPVPLKRHPTLWTTDPKNKYVFRGGMLLMERPQKLTFEASMEMLRINNNLIDTVQGNLRGDFEIKNVKRSKTSR